MGTHEDPDFKTQRYLLMRGKRKKDRGEGGGITQSSSSEKCLMAIIIMANSSGNGFNTMDYGCGCVGG